MATPSDKLKDDTTEGRPTVPLVPRLPWQLFVSEMIGTGVLLLGGLSLVILAFGEGSPVEALVPSVKLRPRTVPLLGANQGEVVREGWRLSALQIKLELLRLGRSRRLILGSNPT